MTPLVEIGCRTLGVVCGAGVSLVIVEPKTRLGFAQRVGVSIAMGYIFADVLAEWLGWSMVYPNRVIAASFLSAGLGWFVMDALIRSVRSGLIPGLPKKAD